MLRSQSACSPSPSSCASRAPSSRIRFSRAHLVIGRLGLAHPFVAHPVFALDKRQFIADLRRRLLIVKVQLAHRAHAILIVINRFRLCSAVWTS
jgi:hypothetical protein